MTIVLFLTAAACWLAGWSVAPTGRPLNPELTGPWVVGITLRAAAGVIGVATLIVGLR